MEGQDERDTHQNLLDEIKYHRNQNVASFSQAEDFVLVSSITIWTNLFVRYFVNSDDASHDDLLMFVRKRAIEGTRYFRNFTTEIEVLRKDSRRLPVGNVDIDWEETLYLNFIMQHFEYHLTCAVVSRVGIDATKIKKKCSQRVYASPSSRSMHGKAESEEITYPSIYFSVDNFEKAQKEMSLNTGDLFCVELTSVNKSDGSQTVLFSGSLDFDSIRNFCDAKVKLPSFGLRSLGTTRDRTSFIKIKCPISEGDAELAITRSPGTTCTTPTRSSCENFFADSVKRLEVTELIQVRKRKSNPFTTCLIPQQEYEFSARVSDLLGQINREWSTSGRPAERTRSLGAGLDLLGDEPQVQVNDLRWSNFGASSKSGRRSSAANVQEFPEMTKNEHSSNSDTPEIRPSSFQFWKQNKRISSLPILAGVTYVTLKVDEIIHLMSVKGQEPTFKV